MGKPASASARGEQTPFPCRQAGSVPHFSVGKLEAYPTSLSASWKLTPLRCLWLIVAILLLSLLGCGGAEVTQTDSSTSTHDEATHDEATHDEATHGEATHGEATHGEATHDEATHDEATHDEATHYVGRILSVDGRPIAGATVRAKGQFPSAVTDNDGQFRLERAAINLDADGTIHLTASKSGFIIGGRMVSQTTLRRELHTSDELEIRLQPLPTADNELYAWVSPHADPAAEFNCANCHPAMVEEWQASGHATAATNRQFQNLYDGSTWHGDQAAGWSLLDELPEGAGVCIACHAPSATWDELGVADMRDLRGVTAEGVHCDYCHKIQEVSAAEFGLTHGRFAAKLLRPTHGQLFFGPLDDVDRGEDSVAAAQTESRFCAACHEGIVFGVPVYTTFTEWQHSAAAGSGVSCQACHMRPSGSLTNIAPGHGGIERDPQTLASHSMMPGGHAAMLRDCVRITTELVEFDQRLRVDVKLQTQRVGHRVPTGFIDRHLILVVEASDAAGQEVNPVDSERLSAAAGDLAGKAGRLFAKQLTDADGITPAPFWRPGSTWTDTRLEPDAAHVFQFDFPSNTRAIRVKLVYRPFWSETTRDKQWPDATQVIHEATYPWPANAQ